MTSNTDALQQMVPLQSIISCLLAAYAVGSLLVCAFSHNRMMWQLLLLRRVYSVTPVHGFMVFAYVFLIVNNSWWIHVVYLHKFVRVDSLELGQSKEEYIDGLVQDCSNPGALAMELLQSCIKLALPNERRAMRSSHLYATDW